MEDEEWAKKNWEEAYWMKREIEEGHLKLKKEFLSHNFRYLLRVTLQMKDGSLGAISPEQSISKQREQRGLVEESYANEGNHIAIFECELK